MKKHRMLLGYKQILLVGLFFSLFSCREHREVKFPEKLEAFPLCDVRLTDGMFKHAMDLDKAWLLSLEPDRLLSGFRLEAGLEPKAPKYGGWESGGVSGHTFGHYLSACAMMYASTGDPQLNERIIYSLHELDTCQQAFGNGLVAGFPRAKELFAEIERGDIRTQGFDLNGGWVPMYTMHKLFAGLIDVYNQTGNRDAYDILIKLSDWFVSVLAPLSDEQIQKILVAEHGGINESLADVYALTREQKYMDISKRLNHQAVLGPLASGKDELAGKHANTQIPKVVGAIRQYELTGDSVCFRIADFFWNTVVNNHTYVIGGNSEAEHFGVPGRTYDRITDKTCETCNSYNMLKLTKHLFELNPSIQKADYYERTLYNQILASQNPEDGMVCYMSPLASGSRKEYSTPFESFWCCVGSGIENHARYGEFIYFTDKQDNLYVNLFIPSDLQWKQRNITVSQQTRFPESDIVSFRLKMEKEQSFVLNIRYPEWAKDGYLLSVNGNEVEISNPGVSSGNYLSLERTWQDGDEVSLHLPMRITSEEARGDSTLRAYLYGPVVLAAILPEDLKMTPVVVADTYMDAGSLVTKDADGLSFTLQKTQPAPIPLIPYYKTGSHKMMVYFSHYTEAQWNERKDFILQQQDAEKWIQEQTVSHFRPGEMQPERDHNFKGEKIEAGELEGRKYRKAAEGGWFSFDMEILPDRPMDLLCTYWGNLGDVYKFSVDVDGVSVSTVIIHWWGNKFIDKTYHIPAELTKGKKKVVVTFKALDGKSIAGPLFDCKILKN